MKTFNHWDVVVSVKQKDTNLEAYVDFEDDNWKVYISERGRNLNTPMRIVLDKQFLVKKDKKVVITKEQLQSLIYEYYPQHVLVDNLDKEIEIKEWLKVEINWWIFIYACEYDTDAAWNKRYLMVKKSHWDNCKDNIYYTATEDEIKQRTIHLKDVLEYIFWNPNTNEFEIILDS